MTGTGLAEARRAFADEDVAVLVESATNIWRRSEGVTSRGKPPAVKLVAVTRTERREKLMPALRPSVATTTRSWPPLARGSTSPARWT